MDYEESLIFNRYFLDSLGCESFEELRTNLVNKQEGYDIEGRSNFLDGIINIEGSKIDDFDLIQYDQAIKRYVEKLRKNRKQPDFNLKYFQYLAVLFSEIFFDKIFNHRMEFIRELNLFIQKLNEEEGDNYKIFSEEDLKKIAFSVATGGGKTLIMHINYWQFLKYSTITFDNIVLIPPNEGLSKQHFKEMAKSGIPCKLYDGNVDNIKTKPGEVLIIDIHKLIEEKTGEGIRVDVSYFDGRNLVFVDEGHKGNISEDEVWKRRREDIARDGFILEYSATFRQVIVGNDKLIEEYGKSIIFEYSYKNFFTDGYGKDFYVYNLKEDRYTERYTDLILIANLLSFYEQLLIYAENKRKLHEFKIEKPLLTFVGGTVTGKIIKSDIPKIIFFFKRIVEDREFLEKNIEKVLNGKSGLIDKNGNDLFKDKFVHLKQVKWGIDDFYDKVFRGKGTLELWELKKTSDEIGLKMSNVESYFGVISVGNVSRLLKIVEEKVEVRNENILDSLFFNIDDNNSPINVLIGSRKFMEGWDSWRVSCMGLLNIGKGKGPQIIQLFGRGVRLKGKEFSLKREETPNYLIKKLQTLSIFGLNADYINTFLEAIEKEEVDYEEQEIQIKLNNAEEWKENLYVIRIQEDFDFTENVFSLKIDEDILRKVRINLRPKVTMAHGLEIEKADTISDESKSILNYTDYLDWDKIYLQIMEYKIAKEYFNLIIDKNTIFDLIQSEKYKILATEEQLRVGTFKEIEIIERLVTLILKNYIDKFYKYEEKGKSMKNLEVERIDEKDENLDFEYIIVKVPSELMTDFEDVFRKMADFHKKDVGEIPTIHFDNHLYSPLVVYQKGKERIKSSPIKLNKGETEFIIDLRKYLDDNPEKFEEKKVFLLRNLSKKGIGFFQKTAGFYPDFILWIKSNNVQKMTFIDPKGIRNTGNFNDEKIQFCISYIKDIEGEVKKRIEEKGYEEEIELDSFIISVTEFDSVKSTFGTGNNTQKDFEDHKIIFQEGDYIQKIIERIV